MPKKNALQSLDVMHFCSVCEKLSHFPVFHSPKSFRHPVCSSRLGLAIRCILAMTPESPHKTTSSPRWISLAGKKWQIVFCSEKEHNLQRVFRKPFATCLFLLTNNVSLRSVPTCRTPWYRQSQKSSKVPRKEAWKTASNIPGIQLSTRKVSGKRGSETWSDPLWHVFMSTLDFWRFFSRTSALSNSDKHKSLSHHRTLKQQQANPTSKRKIQPHSLLYRSNKGNSSCIHFCSIDQSRMENFLREWANIHWNGKINACSKNFLQST